ncbi:MAG: response regulator [Caldilineaceae bacterium]|nr:response regulator [Caldilineaceae bacterium]
MSELLRILLVEDDEDDYILTKELLTEWRVSVLDLHVDLQWVTSFETALTEMKRNRHDIYLLDYQLGAQNGLDLLRTGLAQGCQGPIIFLTGQANRAIDVEAMQAGAVDYLVKSEITAQLLERSIRYALQQKQIRAESVETRQRLADSREAERLRLAQKLHEGPLQDLIGLRFHLGVVLSTLQDEAAKGQLNFVQDNLQTVIESVRAFCVDLRPPALGPFGLEKAIRAHIRRFQAQSPQLNLMMDLDADEQLLPERMRLALYRIFQQALDNVARHAQANNVRISFRLLPDEVQLKVIDDGLGFKPPRQWIDFAREGRIGLLDAMERAEAIGGRLEVTSAPGAGTLLIVTAHRPALVQTSKNGYTQA